MRNFVSVLEQLTTGANLVHRQVEDRKIKCDLDFMVFYGKGCQACGTTDGSTSQMLTAMLDVPSKCSSVRRQVEDLQLVSLERGRNTKANGDQWKYTL